MVGRIARSPEPGVQVGYARNAFQVVARVIHPPGIGTPRSVVSRLHCLRVSRGKTGFLTYESGFGGETDSPLEGGGFEPLVPLRCCRHSRPRRSTFSGLTFPRKKRTYL
jgi:hypothetical protein